MYVPTWPYPVGDPPKPKKVEERPMRPYIHGIAGQYRIQKESKPSKATWNKWIDDAVQRLSKDETFNEAEFRHLCEHKPVQSE
jgi:hypothetical protein